MKCFICQLRPAIEGDLICVGCKLKREGKRVCPCGTGELKVSMKLTNITYYDCEACGERQMVQTGGER